MCYNSMKIINNNRGEILEKERSVIVGVEQNKDKWDIDNSLDELEELVKAAGGEVVGRISQKVDKINAA